MLDYTGRVKVPFRHRFWRWFYDHTAFAYDHILHLADQLHLGSEERIRRQVLATLPVTAGVPVLDLGCGTASSRYYLPADISYIGVDVSRGMLVRARVKCAALGRSAYLVQADAQALPFATGTMGTTLAMGILQHVSDTSRAISETLRVAKPGGQLLLIDERRAQARVLRAVQRRTPQIKMVGEYFVLILTP